MTHAWAGVRRRVRALRTEPGAAPGLRSRRREERVTFTDWHLGWLDRAEREVSGDA